MKKNTNKGFTLVELIIVIAMLALLIAIMVPSLLQYINKAKKAVDITNAEAIGEVFTFAMADTMEPGNEALYKYVVKSAKYKFPDDQSYRVLAVLDAGYVKKEFFLIDGIADAKDQKLITDQLQDVVQGLEFLRFTTKIYLDQWVVCCDQNMKIYVFVGGGCNNHRYYIRTNNDGYDYYVNGNSSFHQYMIWPDVCQGYTDLKRPQDAHK